MRTDKATWLALLLMLLGLLDPLEGSLVILAGICLAAFKAGTDGSPQRRKLYAAVCLAAAGIAALFVISGLGGVGGKSGHPYWWLLAAAPYPAGWLLGVVCAVRKLREPVPAG